MLEVVQQLHLFQNISGVPKGFFPKMIHLYHNFRCLSEASSTSYCLQNITKMFILGRYLYIIVLRAPQNLHLPKQHMMLTFILEKLVTMKWNYFMFRSLREVFSFSLTFLSYFEFAFSGYYFNYLSMPFRSVCNSLKFVLRRLAWGWNKLLFSTWPFLSLFFLRMQHSLAVRLILKSFWSICKPSIYRIIFALALILAIRLELLSCYHISWIKLVLF